MIQSLAGELGRRKISPFVNETKNRKRIKLPTNVLVVLE